MIVGSNILAGASGQAGYFLNRSVRLRSSASAYFNRTPATASNRKTWTWSGWVKRGIISSGQQTIFSGGNVISDTGVTAIWFDPTDVIRIGGSTTDWLKTTQVFRDPSAWYHIVVAMDSTNATANNRLRLYVNGSEVTAFATRNNLTLNADYGVNQALVHDIGIQSASIGLSYFDGYFTEINFIDGQALTPTSFGEFNTLTGVWQPKKYGGTYGTNGFYLNFNDNSAATAAAIGKDSSGNGNNWTPNNISVTAGVTYDSMLDVPTLTSNTNANFAVLNPIITASGTVSNANLTLTAPASNYTYERPSTISVFTGKWYAEYTVTSGGGGYYPGIGAVPDTEAFGSTFTPGITAVGYGIRASGEKYNNSTMSAYGVSYTNGDIVGVALDLINGKIYFSKNGVWMNSGDPAAGTNPAFTGLSGSYCLAVAHYDSGVVNCNFGQRPFSYTPPTGFKSLNTFNLPTPTISNGANQMAATLYTGNGSTQSIVNTVNNISFQPDLVWYKRRNTADNHRLFDAVRGVTKPLFSDLTSAESTESGVTAFNSNGFTLGLAGNESSNTYVAWQWKESVSSGFDIVSQTLSTTGINTINHNLNVVPKMVIAKKTNGVEQWLVYQSSATTQSQYLGLNTTAAVATSANLWGSSAFTSSQIYFSGTSGNVYVFYIFAEIAGYSKFGIYTGNGSTDGTFVYTGFRPRYIMIKRTNSTGDWSLIDTSRSTYNQTNNVLWANLADADSAGQGTDILSNGFKLRSTGLITNASGGT